jgi:aspartate 1-decarboxylase
MLKNYKIKVVSNSKPTKFKTRLVAHGFQQKAIIGYNEVFAHVVKWNTIHIMLSMATSSNWDILHLDVKITFLNGNFKITSLHIHPRRIQLPKFIKQRLLIVEVFVQFQTSSKGLV